MTRDKVSILLMSNRIPNMMVVSDTANNIDIILLMCVVLMPFRFAGAPINQIFYILSFYNGIFTVYRPFSSSKCVNFSGIRYQSA